MVTMVRVKVKVKVRVGVGVGVGVWVKLVKVRVRVRVWVRFVMDSPLYCRISPPNPHSSSNQTQHQRQQHTYRST